MLDRPAGPERPYGGAVLTTEAPLDPSATAATITAAADTNPTGAPTTTDSARSSGAIVRDAVGIGLAVGAYGLSFGALATAGGFSWVQAQVLSLLMYSGAAQFAFVGVAAAGGPPVSAAVTATFLGLRNLFYGVRLGTSLRTTGLARLGTAHFVSDESAAMTHAHPERPRWAFWSASVAVFLCWNLGTFIGAVVGAVLPDPRELGLDAAASAAFLALIAPRLRDRWGMAVVVLAAAIAVAATTVLPSGFPVLLAATAALLGVVRARRPVSDGSVRQPVPARPAGRPGRSA